MNTLIARSIRLAPKLPPCWYAIPLRLIVGGGFLHHGYAKLARGPENFTHILDALGVFGVLFLLDEHPAINNNATKATA